ncbi:MAG: ankyrin repeat domain-containing protein [Bacteriovoracaceae bacterium]
MNIRKKILIIEEDPSITEMLLEIESILGHKFIIQESFESGLEIIKRLPLILLVQEIVINQATSFELISEVKSNESSNNHEIPIVVMNANMSQEYSETMKKKLSGVIQKPFSKDEFVRIVKIILAIDFLKKLIQRLKALENSEDIIKIEGVTEIITEVRTMVKGFIEDNEALSIVTIGEKIEEVLTMVAGSRSQDEDFKTIVSGLEDFNEEMMTVMGGEDFEPISTYVIPGTFEIGESVRKISGTTEHIKEESQMVQGLGEGNIDDEITVVKGSNREKAEEMFKEDDNQIRGAIKGGYQKRSELEKLRADIPDRQNKLGQTFIMLAAEAGLMEDVQKALEDEVKLTIRSHDGRSLMHYACLGGNRDIVELFYEKGLDFKIKDNNGNIPLVSALQGGHTEIAQMIIEKMKNFKYTNEAGRNLLMCAAIAGNLEIFKVLFTKGISPTLKDKKEKTVFALAKKHKQKEILRFLLSQGVQS